MRILLIEDDEKLCEAVKFHLLKEGYTVDICSDGDDGLRWMLQRAHDLVVLDRMLPVMDGVTLLQKARAEGVATPVLLVTALGSVGERVEGLDAGADDYLVKPFATEELLARVRAMCRRPPQMETSQILSFSDVSYDCERRILTTQEKSCTLSKREGDLMEVFFKHTSQIMPREALLFRVWGPDAPVEEGNLDNYIHFLRRRLTSVDSKVTIRTARGVGYRLEGGDV